ncbi:hypothetical protein WA1_13310 [Scytonema hofmannii PCC 7110]|uniref:Nitrile hydratase alpha /Thiocyanate hydrolase gamma domain-containing protein n=1 Tax=Scytonema hofmannii PCC 7110 TaxID=128403 RepID=A0A139XEE5_9CYAN|nr:NHLP leader peptide family RiPP precursor [Scytonema hofmannii]KYC43074.1 hypothetical protein WA1_13310 [Scytonema hofmannii PCC 7110]
MTTNSEALNSQDLQERIIAKAIENPAYKQRLLSDAKAVLEEELDIELPADLSVQVLQQSPKQLYLLLPFDIDELVREGILSESELEAVAGGGVLSLVANTAAQVSIFTSIQYSIEYSLRKTAQLKRKK